MLFGKRGKKNNDNKNNDNDNIKNKNKNIINPGETFNLEIPIPETTREIIINYNDKYGNLYETKGIIKDGKIKNYTRIILYAPFRSRLRSIIISELILGIIGIFLYILMKNYIGFITGLGLYNVLTIVTEIYFIRINKRYNQKDVKDVKDVKENVKNVIEMVKEK